eukprot:6176126-Pleurochrysis_carterae.AAC.1
MRATEYHSNKFTAIYADGGICWIHIPRDPIGCVQSAAMFYVVPDATNVKTMIYMGLHAILGCSTGSSRLCNTK